MEETIKQIVAILWGPLMIILCLGAGVLFSFKTRFMQIRHFSEMLHLLLRRNDSAQGISSFQALTVSLSGRVGVGNIAGVSAAIGFGGPGAVFWMWVIAMVGASTAYVESTLAQIYKEEIDGRYVGGPAYYFEKALGLKSIGVLFALIALVSCALFLPGVQANSVGSAFTMVFGDGEIVHSAFGEVGMNAIIALVIILILLGFIIFGGIKRIAHFAEIIVPFMALGYIIMAMVIMMVYIERLPSVITLIIGDAFNAQAGFGAAIGWGVKRGIYSNEAGQGTATHAAAAAEVEHPAQQGFVQAFSVYIDTLFVCSATAFMLLLTQQYNVQGTLPDGEYIIMNVASSYDINSSDFTQLAVSSVIGGFGKTFVAFALFFFAFTTILAYYYMAETNTKYLMRRFRPTSSDSAVFLIKCVVMFSVAYGCLNSSGYIWAIGDIGVGLMACFNIVGILAIFFSAKPTIIALYDYEKQLANNKDNIVFDPKKLGIHHAYYWEERLQKKEKAD